MRYAGFVLEMKRLIDEGAIGLPKLAWCRHFVGHGGDLYFKSWHADRRNVTSLLLQKGVHDIDILHWLGGGYTRLVTALGDLLTYGGISDRQAVAGTPLPWWQQEDRLSSWPPASQTQLYPVIDVEDASMMLMQLDNGVLASYQQCHFTPDYWRNYTVIGSEGRLENFGDLGPGSLIKVWNRRRANYDRDADLTIEVQIPPGSHGGTDSRIVEEFLNYVRSNERPTTSPVGARQAVAAASAATESLRRGGEPVVIPALDAELAGFFSARG
jgi:predicted dehydrogenase